MKNTCTNWCSSLCSFGWDIWGELILPRLGDDLDWYYPLRQKWKFWFYGVLKFEEQLDFLNLHLLFGYRGWLEVVWTLDECCEIHVSKCTWKEFFIRSLFTQQEHIEIAIQASKTQNKCMQQYIECVNYKKVLIEGQTW